MHWIAGYHPLSSDTIHPYWAPRTTFSTGERLWHEGYGQAQVRTATSGSMSIITIGTCLATDDEFVKGFDYVARNEWNNLAFWSGSYVAIVQQHGQTSVIGDLGGTHRIYYTVDQDGRYWWSTSATALAALSHSSVSYERLLIDLAIDGTERFMGETPFHNVKAVLPGSLLHIRNNAVYIERWHTLPLPISLEEGGERLRSALLTAIERRATMTEGPLASDLSGGLDSSSLAILAARHVGVHGITYVDPWMHGSDLHFAKLVAEHTPNITHTIVTGNHSTVHYSGIDDPWSFPQTDLPAFDLILAAYNRAKIQVASDVGAAHYLNGMAGDCVLHAPTLRIVDQYMSSSRRQAIEEAILQARRSVSAPLKLIMAMRNLARVSYSEELSALARAIPGHKSVNTKPTPPWGFLHWCNLNQTGAWLTSAGKEALSHHVRQYAQIAPNVKLPGAYHSWLNIRSAAAMRQGTMNLAMMKGITLQTPFTDAGVIQAGLSVPTYLRAPSHSFKPLLRAALPEALPEFLLDRTTKGGFDGTMYQGLANSKDGLLELVVNSQLVREGLLDADVIRLDMERAAIGLQSPLSAIHGFVVTELWLAALNLRREFWWTTR